jgi:hypothetical protein
MKKTKLPQRLPEAQTGSGSSDGDTKGGGSWVPSITERHYTPQGEHPEDRIYRDRGYIHRLQRHIDEVYDALEKDLGIKEGNDSLFDFIYNEDRDMEFEDYLSKWDTLYKDIVGQEGRGCRGRNSVSQRSSR